jgi:spore coat protein U-like protein
MRGFLLALAATCVAAPAVAGDIENVRSLDIAVSGSIRQHCALGNIQDMDFGNLERRGLGLDAQVAFDCNMPFTMTIKGAKGALTHTTMPNGQGPFGGQVNYSLAVKMPVRHPAQQIIDQTFKSRQLVAGGVISSNGGIATDGMHLAVRLGDPSGEAGLLAGEYSETITITVSPI